MRRRLSVAITAGQLPVSPEPGVMLRCRHCGETGSAYRGDYWFADPDVPLRCGVCSPHVALLQLVRRVVSYEPVAVTAGTPAQETLPCRK
jgi:hypothetical protein